MLLSLTVTSSNAAVLVQLKLAECEKVKRVPVNNLFEVYFL
ncbi:MAG: hypothetical protein ACI9B7_001794 [Oleispira sp.]|jgi:hypothetical protein